MGGGMNTNRNVELWHGQDFKAVARLVGERNGLLSNSVCVSCVAPLFFFFFFVSPPPAFKKNKTQTGVCSTFLHTNLLGTPKKNFMWA